MDEQKRFEILLEDITGKFDLLIESHQSLQQQIHDMKTELKEDIQLCIFKLDGVATDLKAHRADTEAHHGVYQVRE